MDGEYEFTTNTHAMYGDEDALNDGEELGVSDDEEAGKDDLTDDEKEEETF